MNSRKEGLAEYGGATMGRLGRQWYSGRHRWVNASMSRERESLKRESQPLSLPDVITSENQFGNHRRMISQDSFATLLTRSSLM